MTFPSCSVHITTKNVQGLLGLSCYLQVEELRRRCSDFVGQRITRNNCVDLYLYTQSAGPAELQCHAEDYILTHFEQVVGKSKDFAKLSQSQLRSLISSNRLLISGEGAVYKVRFIIGKILSSNYSILVYLFYMYSI